MDGSARDQHTSRELSLIDALRSPSRGIRRRSDDRTLASFVRGTGESIGKIEFAVEDSGRWRAEPAHHLLNRRRVRV